MGVRRTLWLPSRRTPEARSPYAFVGLLAAITATPLTALGAVAADAPRKCPVTVTPANAAEAWVTAALVARDHLQRAAAEGGCATLDIQVSADRAFVVFTTRDGRHTVRLVGSPDEIGPLVDALLVTVEEVPPAQPTSAAVSPLPLPALNQKPTDSTGAPVTVARVVLRGSAGARLGLALPGVFVSPSLSASAGVLVGPWELSAFGAWDPASVLLDQSLPGFTMSRYAVGVEAGRRFVVGSGLLNTGISAAAAISFPDVAGAVGAIDLQSPGEPEPLVGLYGGFSYPRRSPLRFRTELSTDVVVYRPPLNGQSQPKLPLWSTTASLGAEWEVP